MLLHRIHIAADNRSAESSPRAECGIVRQRLVQDGNHALPRRLPSYSRQSSDLLRGRKERSEERRRKSSPGVIGSFIFLPDRIGVTAHVPDDATCYAQGGWIPLERKRHS